METIFKNPWIFLIGVTIANGMFLKHNSKKYIAQNPELEQGYDMLFKGLITYGNIPWVIMMIGNLSGMTQYGFEYLNPRAMNPMVLAFHLSIILLWVLGIRWIYFKNGAEFMESHPGLLRKKGFGDDTDLTAIEIKMFFSLMLMGGITGMVILWVVDLPF